MATNFSILINSLTGGGAERQVFHLWKKFRPEVQVLEEELKYPIAPHDIKFIGVGIKINKFLLPLYALRVQKNNKVLSFLEFSNFVNVIGSLFYSYRAFISVRISPSYYRSLKLGGIYIKLIQWLYPLAEKIICNSEDCAEEVFSLTGKRPYVIHNAIDLTSLASHRRSNPINKVKKISAMGRLMPQKNFQRLLQVFKFLSEKDPELSLMILGEGPLENELKDLAQKLGILENVHFAGFQENPFPHLAQTDLFILSSVTEGFPNVLIEAMSLGLPVVAGDCPTGPREILLDRYGLLLPLLQDDTIQDWVQSLTELINNSEKLQNLQKKSLERAEAYEYNKIMRDWARILEVE